MPTMIDIETLSSRNDAVILSIGAVEFPMGVISEPEELSSFYVTIRAESQPDRHIDPNTVAWWMEQSEEAKHIFKDESRLTLSHALHQLQTWFVGRQGPCYAYGATFDHVLIQDAYNKLNKKNPISYRDQLCMRTVVKMANLKCPEVPNMVAHRAVDDAIRQAIWIQHCFEKLGIGE